MTSEALMLLVAALIPAATGLLAWRKRGNPGAATLAALMWALALWSAAHALGHTTRQDALESTLRLVEQTTLLSVGALWLAFALLYTGRGQRLTRTRTALIAAVPLVTLALIAAVGGGHDPVWPFESHPRTAGSEALTQGLWLYLELVYRLILVVTGTALLVFMLLNSHRLYVMQSLCLLAGLAAPWAAITAHQFKVIALPLNAYLTPAAFVISGLAITWALLRYGLLDLSPIARDTLVDGMSDGTLVLDLQNRIVDINPAAEDALGGKASELLGEDFRRVMGSRVSVTQEGRKRGSELVGGYEKDGRARREISVGKGKNARHYDVSLSSLYDGRGKRTGHLAVLHETTGRKQAVERLDRMARYDALTGLPNRAYFHERLNEEIARARRSQSLLALLFLDLDGFKKINDTLGHEVGDLLLRETAGRIQAVLREYDFPARLAGDEFTVIVPEAAKAADATIAAERIVETLAEPFYLADSELRITTSVGISFFPTDGTDSATLINNADAAMYQAKQGGKNRYALFAPAKLKERTEHHELELELARALDNDELSLLYQPEVQLGTNRTVGVEALLQWEHPSRGLLRSEDFLPHVEETNFVFSMERWVLREACRQVRSWQERYPSDPPFRVSVRLFSRHLMHPSFASDVRRILQEAGTPPESLMLEIPETVLDDETVPVADTLEALEKLGVGLAVGGFGGGSSSVNQLTRFPLDELKIDSSSIARMTGNAEGGKAVSGIIALAHALELRVVAQGVHNPQQLVGLRKMGCDAAQGAYLAEPLSREQISATLASDLAGTPML